MNNLPKVVAKQRHGRGSNPRPLGRKSDALPLSHRATPYRKLKQQVNIAFPIGFLLRLQQVCMIFYIYGFEHVAVVVELKRYSVPGAHCGLNKLS